MAILRAGDYVMVEGEGIGQITAVDFHPHFHLVYFLDGRAPMALLKKDKTMTKIDPAFHKLLTDVYKESDDERNI
jgi:hypothetical protein